ncbi:unnamed protein product [Larinioides sclopetarius]|uniref:Uncharacterized protein n=1 Tax=Larinioides sclopetarius TaxID=280406 RepID=A0AAV1Z8V9_9ARAC
MFNDHHLRGVGERPFQVNPYNGVVAPLSSILDFERSPLTKRKRTRNLTLLKSDLDTLTSRIRRS